MEVKLHPTIPGCIYWPCTLMTFGLFPLILRAGEAHLPKIVDEQGVTTRGGKRYAWTDFTRATRVKVRGKGGYILSDEILLDSPTGKVGFLARMVDADKVKEYALQHLPDHLFKQ
ncbi:MAG TPA: hypothetical protein VGO93_01925 [Candidatus Xenobia bacterium]|jgi:hypothetical protein